MTTPSETIMTKPHSIIPTPEQIRAHRLSMGLTQAQYGKLIGNSGSAVGHWETGRFSPNASAVGHLLALMHPKNDAPQASIPEPDLTLEEYRQRHAPRYPDADGCRARAQESLKHHAGDDILMHSEVIDLCTTLHVHGQDILLTSNLHRYGIRSQAVRDFMRSYAPPAGAILEESDTGEGWVDVITPQGDAWLAHLLRAMGLYETTIRRRLILLAAANRIEEGALYDAQHPIEPSPTSQAEPSSERKVEDVAPKVPASQADPTPALKPPTSSLDIFAAALAAMREQEAKTQQLERDVQAQREASRLTQASVTEQRERLEQIERRLEVAPIAGDLTAFQIAQRGDYLSISGRPHSSAVVALGHMLGLEEEGESYLVMAEINDRACPAQRYTPRGASLILRELAALAERTEGPFFNVKAGSKTYTVHKPKQR